MAKARPTKRKPRARALSDQAVLHAIVADVERLLRERESEVARRQRVVTKLLTSKRSTRQQIDDASRSRNVADRARGEARRLYAEIASVVDGATAQLAALEVEITTKIEAAIIRYLAASTSPGEVPARAKRGDFVDAFEAAKYATAIAYADRRKMREQLASLAGDTDRRAEADQWRRELAVQEVAVAHLQRGLRLLATALPVDYQPANLEQARSRYQASRVPR